MVGVGATFMALRRCISLGSSLVTRGEPPPHSAMSRTVVPGRSMSWIWAKYCPSARIKGTGVGVATGVGVGVGGPGVGGADGVLGAPDAGPPATGGTLSTWSTWRPWAVVLLRARNCLTHSSRWAAGT